MTTLRVYLDPLASAGSAQTTLGRYTRELTRAIVSGAPRDCDVEGIIAATTDDVVEGVRALLPGIGEIQRASLGSRELGVAWQLGVIGRSASGLVHSPTLLAPLRKHDRANGDQVSVTVHDVFAWTHPEWSGATSIARDKALLRRARKHADAIVVQSHALAVELAEIADLGDRIRVIPGAGRSGLTVPFDAVTRVKELELPSQYILTSGSLHPREGIEALATGLERNGMDLPLLVLDAVAPEPTTDADTETPTVLHSDQVRFLGDLDDADRAVVLSARQAFVFPALDDGFGAPIIDALRFGVPVVHSDAPALVELSGGAAVSVERADAESYPDRLAAAVTSLLADEQRARRLGVFGSDRAKLFGWRDAGERIWQLHADL